MFSGILLSFRNLPNSPVEISDVPLRQPGLELKKAEVGENGQTHERWKAKGQRQQIKRKGRFKTRNQKKLENAKLETHILSGLNECAI